METLPNFIKFRSVFFVVSKEVQIVGASGYTNEAILKVIHHLNNKKTNIAIMVTQV